MTNQEIMFVLKQNSSSRIKNFIKENPKGFSFFCLNFSNLLNLLYGLIAGKKGIYETIGVVTKVTL